MAVSASIMVRLFVRPVHLAGFPNTVRQLGRGLPLLAMCLSTLAATGCHKATGWWMNNSAAHYYQRGDYAMARKEFAMAVRDQPYNPDYRYNLAMAMKRVGDPGSAEQVLRHNLSLDAMHQPTYHALATTLTEQGRQAEALDIVESWVATQPYVPEAHVELAALHRQMGSFDQAEQSLRQALTIEPQNPVILSQLGQLYQDQGQPQQAMQYYQQSLVSNWNQPEVERRLASLARGMQPAGQTFQPMPATSFAMQPGLPPQGLAMSNATPNMTAGYVVAISPPSLSAGGGMSALQPTQASFGYAAAPTVAMGNLVPQPMQTALPQTTPTSSGPAMNPAPANPPQTIQQAVYSQPAGQPAQFVPQQAPPFAQPYQATQSYQAAYQPAAMTTTGNVPSIPAVTPALPPLPGSQPAAAVPAVLPSLPALPTLPGVASGSPSNPQSAGMIEASPTTAATFTPAPVTSGTAAPFTAAPAAPSTTAWQAVPAATTANVASDERIPNNWKPSAVPVRRATAASVGWRTSPAGGPVNATVAGAGSVVSLPSLPAVEPH